MRYEVIIDGKEMVIPHGKKWRLACCDCGLVHDVAIVVRKRTVGIAMRRNKRSTTMRRKAIKT